MVKKIYKWKPVTTSLQGRPKNRWDDNVKQAKEKLSRYRPEQAHGDQVG
jgi:hypothetical protein